MIELSPRILNVSQYDSTVLYNSISKAADEASEGDQIVVGPGTYNPQTTKERFPIYIPPRCQLIGSGAETCKIDGSGGGLQIISRPVNPYQSLVLLGDNTSLSGFTILNSDANGISNEQGARILVVNNVLRDNGQHGLLIFGTNGAYIQNNQFRNNGTKEENYKPPRSDVAGRQGHQIFIESRADTKNDVIITGNKMEKTYADAIAIDVFDQPEGIKMHVQVIGNIISGCGRNGFSMAGSYGPSNSNVFIEIRNNQILDTHDFAIDAQATFSLIFRAIHNAKLFLNIVENKIKNCNCAINLAGAFSPSENSHVEYNIVGNEISNTERYGIRAISGVGMNDWPVENTRCYTTIANNKFFQTGKEPIFVQGGIDAGSKKVRNNSMFLHLVGNNLESSGKIIVNDGLATNFVKMIEGSQQYERKNEVVPYDFP